MNNSHLKKNDVLELAVTGMTQNGFGVARTDGGFTVFVKCACAGDKVAAKVIKVAKSYAVAIIDSLIVPSPDRVGDACSAGGKCGGCVFRHVDYSAECRFKEKSINDAFERIAHLPLKVSEFHAAESTLHYRNKAIYPISALKDGKAIAGFYAEMSHRIVPHDVCLIGDVIFSRIKDEVTEYIDKNRISIYDEVTKKGGVRAVYMRSSKRTEDCGEKVVLTLIINDESAISTKALRDFALHITDKFPEITSVLVNVNSNGTNAVLGKKWINLLGDGYLHDTLCGKSFRISPASFYQVNHDQTEVLYGIAKRFAALRDGEKLLDLYCGTGTVGICIAESSTRLIGVEIVPEAVTDAKYNAEKNGINAEFICLDAEKALDDERLYELCPDVITLDPPRKGCGEEAARKIAKMGAKRIVYISCDPATLARDLAEFDRCGYKAERAEAVDMFPRTGHVETVVLLSQRRPDDYVKVKIDLDDYELTKSESKATYGEIKEYVLQNHGLKVSSLYIAQVKKKYGIELGESYNLPKSDDAKQPQCPKEKEDAIVDALKHFRMI